jgi:glycosyltransferase involved in cell wall biosynthesis
VDNERRLALRQTMGLDPDDIMILQPTRIVQRKGIEHAIDLVKDLNDPRCKLVISHEVGDEGFEYADWLREEAREHGVDLRLFSIFMRDPWTDNKKIKSEYTLLDVYPCADFITYPSLYEGFGNAFLEAVYFKKPMLINRYAIFVRDIEPKGFDLVGMNGFLTKKNVEKVKNILTSEKQKNQMVDHNYQVAQRYYSYSVLRGRLDTLMTNFFGMKS